MIQFFCVPENRIEIRAGSNNIHTIARFYLFVNKKTNPVGHISKIVPRVHMHNDSSAGNSIPQGIENPLLSGTASLTSPVLPAQPRDFTVLPASQPTRRRNFMISRSSRTCSISAPRLRSLPAKSSYPRWI